MHQYKLLLTFGSFMVCSTLARPQEGVGSPPPACTLPNNSTEYASNETICGSPNSEGKEKDMMNGCCTVKENCYTTCNSLKTDCDNQFQQCMVSACIDSNEEATNFIRRRCATGWSWNGPGMIGHKVAQAQDFGCSTFAENQRNCH
ncbi:hypothetical protein K493DRAFT_295714 [Basidiobolus meristosporus CBS 931.73]|uniref:Uncharacterized protein n=1 Tax=Basidiobolus meristosporus CBS 931.73 TaxID=1314790 RepID=A0A1Y1Z9M5_9FUNG|nr:hypothetical protein K493DRAFT_295714 [Basidiobolus meristosporus CBS 931.73]|eukprot:ORY06951.1 hypothetical protein K493DRAFT_295714 [Basidiobolus meristosporus CBS 931.73]